MLSIMVYVIMNKIARKYNKYNDSVIEILDPLILIIGGDMWWFLRHHNYFMTIFSLIEDDIDD